MAPRPVASVLPAPRPNAPKPVAPANQMTSAQHGAVTGANKQWQVVDPALLPGFAQLTPDQQAAYRTYYTKTRDKRMTILPQLWAQLGPKYGQPGQVGAPGSGGDGGPAASPMPWDTQYETTVSGINRSTGVSLANLQAQQGQLGQSYGYSYDPITGAVAADPSNPFSRAALLKQSYDRSKKGSTNSMAAQGQLYAGAAQNAQNYLGQNFLQSDDALKRDFASQAQSLLAQRAQTLADSQNQLDQANTTRLTTAIANAQSNPVDPGKPQPPKSPLGGLPAAAGASVASQTAWLKSHPKWRQSAEGKAWLAKHPATKAYIGG